jgi:hypothetical protein
MTISRGHHGTDSGKASRWAWLWLPLAFFIVGSSWAVTSPVGSAPDDDYHLASIWCAQGDREGVCLDTGLSPPKYIVVAGAVNASFCFATNPNTTGDCTDAELGSTELILTDRLNNIQQLYPGGYYSVLSVFAGSDVQRSVYIMRIFNVALVSALLLLLMRLTPAGIRQATLLAFIAGFTPLGIFLIASTNPSGWAITGVLFTAAFGLALIHRKSWRSRRTWLVTLGLVLSATMAITARVDSAAFVAVVVGLIFLIAGVTRMRQQLIGSALLVALALIGIYTYFATTPLTGGGSLGTSEPDTDLLWSNLFNIPELIQGIVGGWPLGWNDTALPAVIPVVGLLVIGALAYAGLGSTWRSKNIAMFISLVALIGFPLLFMQSQGVAVGEVIQSRYLLPLFGLLLVIILLPKSVNKPLKLTRTAGIVIGVSLWFSLNLAWWVNVHRYAVGTDSHFFDTNFVWSYGPPVLVTAAVTLGASAALIAGIVVPSYRLVERARQ